MSSPNPCPHCVDGACVHRVCDVCPCPVCVTARTPCAVCVTWIGRLGASLHPQLVTVATDRGTTVTEARTQVLAAYHRYHQEDS